MFERLHLPSIYVVKRAESHNHGVVNYLCMAGKFDNLALKDRTGESGVG